VDVGWAAFLVNFCKYRKGADMKLEGEGKLLRIFIGEADTLDQASL